MPEEPKPLTEVRREIYAEVLAWLKRQAPREKHWAFLDRPITLTLIGSVLAVSRRDLRA